MPKDKPEIRFAGYPDAWEKRQLGELLNYERPDKYIVDSDNYDTSGIPVLTANKSFILGYTHETDLYDKGDSIIFDDFTLDNKYVDFPYKVKSSAIKILTQTKGTSLRFAYELLNHTHIEQEGHARHYISIVQPKKVLVPQLSEQIKIAQLFKSTDRLITVNQRKVDLLKELKKGFLQKMFPKNGEDKPEIRFSGFTDAWEKRRLGEYANYRRGSFPQPYGNKEWYGGKDSMPFVQVVDVTNKLTLVDDTKQKISKLAQSKSVFVPKGKVVITLQGSIGRVAITQYDSYVDRTLLIFENYVKPTNEYFWAYTLQQKFEIEKRRAPGGTIKTITKEALSIFEVHLPEYKEQVKIGTLFQYLDTLITVNQRRVDLLKQEKKALLQKMFV